MAGAGQGAAIVREALTGQAPRRMSAFGPVEDRRQLRRVRLVRALFVFGLVAWTSLAAWWGTYFYRSSIQVRDATLEKYALLEKLYAEDLDRTPTELLPDALATIEHASQEILDVAPLPVDADAKNWPYVLVPTDRPTHAVVVAPHERRRLERDLRNKHIMLAGEGTLLVGLLFVCLVGLYRMLVGEWRLRRQTESFVHAVTHELKSPLAGLRALLQSFATIEMRPDERAAYVQMGLAELERLDAHVANILLSSRLEAHVFQPQLVDVDLAQVLCRLRDRKLLLFQERGGTFEVETPDVRAQVDPEALGTILENLVDNALKYSPGAPRVRVGVRREGERVCVDVSDHGLGLSAGDRERVFDKFYRAPDGEVQVAKGTGLGLFIARGLARACGGELSAQSPGRGKGATFTLTLRG